MANEQERRTENFLEREQREKKRERYERNIRNQQAKNAKLAPKVNKEEMLKELMTLSEHEVLVRLSEAREKTDNAIERLLAAKEHYKGADREEKIQRLQRETNNAKKEEKYLEGYADNGKQIKKIYNMEQAEIARRQKNLQSVKDALVNDTIALEEIKTKLNENEDKVKSVREKQKSLDEKIKKLVEKTEKFGQGEAEITEEQSAQQIEDLKKISDLSEKRTKVEDMLKSKENSEEIMNLTSEKKRLEEAIKGSKTKIKLYEKGESKEDTVIHKCRLAREMLLAGKSWDEINLASIKEIKERQLEVKESDRSEPSPEPKPEPKQEQGQGHYGPKSEPKQEPKSEPKQEPLPPVPAKFEERHPRLSKIPFLARFVNGFTEGRRKAMAKKIRNKNDDIDWIKEPSDDEPAPIEPRKPQAPVKEPIKDKRDKFMEYLREAVEEGHKEQGKYATSEPKMPEKHTENETQKEQKDLSER